MRKPTHLRLYNMQRVRLTDVNFYHVEKENTKEDLAREKIDSQEDIALLRAEVNRERIQQGTAGRGE